MRIKHKRCLIAVACVIIAVIFMELFSPVAFIRKGFLTKFKVEEFEDQYIYELERIGRHGADEVENIYMFYLGFREISVEGARKGDRPKVERTVPFLYHWEMDKDNDAYKVTIGKKKYYFAWLFN